MNFYFPSLFFQVHFNLILLILVIWTTKNWYFRKQTQNLQSEKYENLEDFVLSQPIQYKTLLKNWIRSRSGFDEPIRSNYHNEKILHTRDFLHNPN